jgi:hypothetical protein
LKNYYNTELNFERTWRTACASGTGMIQRTGLMDCAVVMTGFPGTTTPKGVACCAGSCCIVRFWWLVRPAYFLFYFRFLFRTQDVIEISAGLSQAFQKNETRAKIQGTQTPRHHIFVSFLFSNITI